MKIIFICTKSITFNTFLKSQAEYFTKKGFVVEVVTSDIENINLKKTLKNKIDFPTKTQNFFDLKRYIKIFFQIRFLISKNKSALFYLHTPVAAHFFRLFTFFYNLKIIYFVHGFRFTAQTGIIKSFVYRSLEKFLSLKTSMFITINNEDFNYVKNNFKNIPCYKINGVGLNLKPNNFKKKLKNKNSIKKILVIAAYKIEKGYPEILNVANQIKRNRIKISCYGYGDYSKFESIKIKNKLNNLTFNKFDLSLHKKIINFDILLHLSKREGLPVAIMQCLSEGLPVICYNIRGNNDLVKDEFNGMFVNSYEEVLTKINYLNLDKNFFNVMRKNSILSINNNFCKKQINLNLFKIFKNFNNKNNEYRN